jgi:hypothetical protein
MIRPLGWGYRVLGERARDQFRQFRAQTIEDPLE